MNILQRRIKRQTEQNNCTFIKQLTDSALKEMERFSDYGHKLIEVENIGIVSNVRL